VAGISLRFTTRLSILFQWGWMSNPASSSALSSWSREEVGVGACRFEAIVLKENARVSVRRVNELEWEREVTRGRGVDRQQHLLLPDSNNSLEERSIEIQLESSNLLLLLLLLLLLIIIIIIIMNERRVAGELGVCY
jgi:hypothetical protein